MAFFFGWDHIWTITHFPGPFNFYANLCDCEAPEKPSATRKNRSHAPITCAPPRIEHSYYVLVLLSTSEGCLSVCGGAICLLEGPGTYPRPSQWLIFQSITGEGSEI